VYHSKKAFQNITLSKSRHVSNRVLCPFMGKSNIQFFLFANLLIRCQVGLSSSAKLLVKDGLQALLFVRGASGSILR